MSEPVAVGVDVGGTKLLAATIDGEGRVLERRREPSPTGDADALLGRIVALVEDLGPDLPVGVGIAGIVTNDGTLVYGPNVRVTDVPIAQELERRFEVPVVVANDATVALYGEYRAGAAAEHPTSVMFTLGTGVGGAVLLDGTIVTGAHGFAGELGHLIVEEGGRRCGCGNLGCVEAYSSGTAIGAMARERLAAEPGTETGLREAAPLDGRAVSAAAVEGDTFAREVLLEAGTWLGVAMATLANAFDPSAILLGGGAATQTAGWVVPAASASMRERILGREHRPLPPIILAQLGDDAGMIGAALLAASAAG